MVGGENNLHRISQCPGRLWVGWGCHCTVCLGWTAQYAKQEKPAFSRRMKKCFITTKLQSHQWVCWTLSLLGPAHSCTACASGWLTALPAIVAPQHHFLQLRAIGSGQKHQCRCSYQFSGANAQTLQYFFFVWLCLWLTRCLFWPNSTNYSWFSTFSKH